MQDKLSTFIDYKKFLVLNAGELRQKAMNSVAKEETNCLPRVRQWQLCISSTERAGSRECSMEANKESCSSPWPTDQQVWLIDFHTFSAPPLYVEGIAGGCAILQVEWI